MRSHFLLALLVGLFLVSGAHSQTKDMKRPDVRTLSIDQLMATYGREKEQDKAVSGLVTELQGLEKALSSLERRYQK
jgi:hypothetical protein